jgi:hypothetical protein
LIEGNRPILLSAQERKRRVGHQAEKKARKSDLFEKKLEPVRPRMR